MHAATRSLLRPCTRTLRRGLSFNPQGRPIILQRIEQAAREGDLDKVRQILREHDAHASVSSAHTNVAGLPGSRPSILTIILAYAAWNALATWYDYRVVSNEADEQMKTAGPAEDVSVRLHCKSFRTRAELSTQKRSVPTDDEEEDPPWLRGAEDAAAADRKRVLVFPHLYVTDIIFGRSSWRLTCRKRNGHTMWFTGPDEDEFDGRGGGGNAGGGTRWEWSSSSSIGGRRGEA